MARPKPKEPWRQTGFRLPESMKQSLQSRCEIDKTSMQDFIMEGIHLRMVISAEKISEIKQRSSAFQTALLITEFKKMKI